MKFVKLDDYDRLSEIYDDYRKARRKNEIAVDLLFILSIIVCVLISKGYKEILICTLVLIGLYFVLFYLPFLLIPRLALKQHRVKVYNTRCTAVLDSGKYSLSGLKMPVDYPLLKSVTVDSDCCVIKFGWFVRFIVAGHLKGVD